MKAPVRLKVRKWHIVLLLTIAVIIAATAYFNRRKLIEVQVTSPVFQDLETTVATGGTVVPLHDFPARANFGGMVSEINVHLGEKVHEGQLLLTMKDQYALTRLENAKAALESAQLGDETVRNNGSPEDRIGFASDLRRARQEQTAASTALSTLQELHKRGSVSDAELAAGVQRLQNANDSLQSLQQRDKQRFGPEDIATSHTKVAAARAALEAERVSYRNAYVTSPINGTVYIIPVSRFDFVPVGADLLRVADLTQIQVHADFDEPEISKLHDGQAVKIEWEGRPDRTWHGHVAHAPMAITAEPSRNIGQCTISVDDADGDLPADSHVTVTVTIQTQRHALAVPRQALHTEGTKRFVYRVVDDRLEKTPVQVGLVDLFHAQITGGLTDKDLVVVRSHQGDALQDHQRVTPVR